MPDLSPYGTMKKLYKLRVIIDTVVAAESDRDAREYVHQCSNLAQIAENDGATKVTGVKEITSKEELPKFWDQFAIPWGIEPSREVIQQFLEK